MAKNGNDGTIKQEYYQTYQHKHKAGAMRILIVDDLVDIRLLLKLTLRRFRPQWEIIEAGEGAEAVDLALQLFPDAVIMNIHMPKMDGLEAVRILRHYEETADMPIVIYSAASYLQQEALEAGANQFFVKPTNAEELIDCLEFLTTYYQTADDL